MPESFGDRQRQLAALLAQIVASERETEERVRKLAEKERRIGIEPGAEHLLERPARAARASSCGSGSPPRRRGPVSA